MKKIMFNDRYGLTSAVLRGDKTMTRRIIPLTDVDRQYLDTAFDFDFREMVIIDQYSRFKVGEDIAVAQKYKDCWDIYQEQWEAKKYPFDWLTPDAILGDQVDKVKGWSNKMFVRADLMPHRIRITNIRVERLQDISDEDCLKEGIYEDAEEHGGLYTTPFYDFLGNEEDGFYEPRAAFAALIDKVSGNGTWERNPWVFVCKFELVK